MAFLLDIQISQPRFKKKSAALRISSARAAKRGLTRLSGCFRGILRFCQTLPHIPKRKKGTFLEHAPGVILVWNGKISTAEQRRLERPTRPAPRRSAAPDRRKAEGCVPRKPPAAEA